VENDATAVALHAGRHLWAFIFWEIFPKNKNHNINLPQVVEISKICNKIVSMIQVMLVLIQHALCLWFYTSFKLMFKDASLGARLSYARFQGIFELFMLLIK
jgi:hypothetical protein